MAGTGSSSSAGPSGSLPSMFQRELDRLAHAAATPTISSSSTTTGQTGPPPAMSKEEKLLRAVEREIERSYAAKRLSCPSPSLRQLVRKATKKSPDASKKPSSSSPPSPAAERRAAAAAAASLASALRNPSDAGTEQERMPPEGHGAAYMGRSAYAAAMKSAMLRIQSADAGGNGEAEAFSEMEQAMKGLMDVSFSKNEAPATPSMFLSRCPRSDEDQFRRDVIADPVILPSGDTIDKFSHHWFSRGADEPSLTAPNHLMRDTIAAWCRDHSIPLPSPPVPTSAAIDEAPSPSEEEMPLILEKLSRHSVQQQEALHSIRVMSRTSNGAQPCLAHCQELLPKLIHLHKKWKASWSRELEEERLAIILNLSLHRPNREILAADEHLPNALRKTVRRAKKIGSPLATMAMVAAVTAILSEHDAFRKRAADAGVPAVLRGLLGVEDAVVRNEACAALLALCTGGGGDDDGAAAAVTAAGEALLRCLLDGHAGEECLLLLERALRGGGFAAGWTDAHVAQLVSGVAGGRLTPRGVESSIGLVCSAIRQDAAMLKKAEKLGDFVEALKKLQSKGGMAMALERIFQIEEILLVAAEPLQDSTGASSSNPS